MDSNEIKRVSLKDFLHIIFKSKMQILLFFSATVCTVAVASFVIKPTYMATAQILVKVGRENIYIPTGSDTSPVLSTNIGGQINSEIEILRSRSLAEEIVASLSPKTIYPNLNVTRSKIVKAIIGGHEPRSLVDKAVLKLQKNVKVEWIKDSSVIKVSFKHKDPKMAALVVNSLVHFYLDHHLKVHTAPESYKFFQEQSQILKKELGETEEKLKAFKKLHNISSITEERSLLLNQEAALRSALNQSISQEAETKNRIHQLTQQLAITSESIPQGKEVDHNPLLINTLQARLVELEIREKELLNKYTKNSRLVKNVREEIRIVKDKLANQEKKQHDTNTYGLNIIYQRLKDELLKNETDMKALEGKKESQEFQLKDYQQRLEKLNEVEVELNQLKREVDAKRQNYSLYLNKFEESRISSAMDTEKITNVNLIEPAKAPLEPVSPKVLLNLLLSVLLGALGGFGLAFFREYLDDSIETIEDVEDCLHLPVLASIPYSK
jgi:uncharacterized protein involved in exopolysaccharide biosynthesis